MLATGYAVMSSQAESQASSPVVKKVLVYLGIHEREITFATDICETIRRTFSNVLPPNGHLQFVLQLKNEDWRGEFVDIDEDEVVDKSVLMAVPCSDADTGVKRYYCIVAFSSLARPQFKLFCLVIWSAVEKIFLSFGRKKFQVVTPQSHHR